LTDYFLDSSALTKLYHQESGTWQVQLIAASAGSRITISRLATVEIRSSFAIKVRNRVTTRPVGLDLLRRFQRDVLSKRFDVTQVSDADFDLAGTLVERYAFDHRLRSLDALQLATAVQLWRAGRLDYFVAADKVLCEVAALEGMAVINPDVT